MEIYDLCENDGLASGVYRLEFIGAARREAVKILKFAAFGLTHCAAAEILSQICRRGAAMAAMRLRFTRNFGSLGA
nr:hypothetical protein [uncultured Campylobacter sp.]